MTSATPRADALSLDQVTKTYKRGGAAHERHEGIEPTSQTTGDQDPTTANSRGAITLTLTRA